MNRPVTSPQIPDKYLPGVSVAMDESGNGNPTQPLIVGGVVFDGTFKDAEQRVRQLHEELSASSSLDGYSAFTAFQSHGFHLAVDSPEISVPFFQLISRETGMSIYMIMKEREPSGPDDDEENEAADEDEDVTLTNMYTFLTGVIMAKYRQRPSIDVYIEENHSLRALPRTLASSATRTLMDARSDPLRHPLPTMTVTMESKVSVMATAIIDYAMMTTSRWQRAGCTRDRETHQYRNFRKIEPAISLLYSFDRKTLSARSRRFSD